VASTVGLWGDENELRKGELGKGLWPGKPPNVSFVGVLGPLPVEDSVDDGGRACVGEDKGGARGVVGVVTSTG